MLDLMVNIAKMTGLIAIGKVVMNYFSFKSIGKVATTKIGDRRNEFNVVLRENDYLTDNFLLLVKALLFCFHYYLLILIVIIQIINFDFTQPVLKFTIPLLIIAILISIINHCNNRIEYMDNNKNKYNIGVALILAYMLIISYFTLLIPKISIMVQVFVFVISVILSIIIYLLYHFIYRGNLIAKVTTKSFHRYDDIVADRINPKTDFKIIRQGNGVELLNLCEANILFLPNNDLLIAKNNSEELVPKETVQEIQISNGSNIDIHIKYNGKHWTKL